MHDIKLKLGKYVATGIYYNRVWSKAKIVKQKVNN